MSGPAREDILREIQRYAAENGGTAPGTRIFERETGIRINDWSGKYWARWGDAIAEAGLSPNSLQEKVDEEVLLRQLAELVARLGHFPSTPELRLHRRTVAAFPSDTTFWNRFGNRDSQVAKLAAFAATRPEFADVHRICEATPPARDTRRKPVDSAEEADDGYVYLLRSGKFYKIGRTNAAGRRERELAIQLPERAERVHVIRTDDPAGIESYWHQRFAMQRKNGEWFDLSASDIQAFKRRKFM